MRQNELDQTYSQVMNDIKEGKYHTSLERHFSEIDEAIKIAYDYFDWKVFKKSNRFFKVAPCFVFKVQKVTIIIRG